MRSLVILSLAIVGASGVAHPNSRPNQSPAQSQLLKVARTYIGGDTAAAIEMLRADGIGDQRRTAKEIVQTHGVVVGGSARSEPGWTLPLLRAAGAVHMEAALDHYKRGGRNQQVVIAQMEVGELLLDEVGRLEQQPSEARRWEWAIGGQAMADGAFAIARDILTRACDRYRKYPGLLVSCGTVHETYAAINFDSAAVAGAVDRGTPTTPDLTTSTLLNLRTARHDNLNRARDTFEEAVSMEPSLAEAMLRLGKVQLELGDAGDAAKTLEPLVRLNTDRRMTYLSRLFLGRVRERQKRFDEAIALFGEATEAVPAQSGRLALVNRLHAVGRNGEALTLAETVASDRDTDDPWWSYRMGQYWLVEPTLESLRQQARSSAGTPAAAR